MPQVIFNSVLTPELTLGSTLMMLGTAIVLGLLTALVYILTHKSEGYSSGIVMPLILIPPISASIILLVGTNTAAALSLAGAAAVIRFRTTLASPKDLTYFFFALAMGLGCGTGYIGYTACFTVIVLLVIFVCEKLHVGYTPAGVVRLRITIPENIDYPGAFDDILNEYTTRSRLCSVKTTEYGSLCELVYNVRLKKDCEIKQLIDALRERNGNLSVRVVLAPDKESNYIA